MTIRIKCLLFHTTLFMILMTSLMTLLKHYFFKKEFWITSVLFGGGGSLIRRFGTSVDICPGFQIRGGSPHLHSVLLSCNGILRFICGPTPADLLTASMAAKPFSSTWHITKNKPQPCHQPNGLRFILPVWPVRAVYLGRVTPLTCVPPSVLTWEGT